MHQLGLRFRLVQRLREGLALPLLPPLRKQVPLMSEQQTHDCLPAPDPENRAHWLRIAGFIAGADGLSVDEAVELAHDAASPELDREAASAILIEAAAGALPEDSIARVAAEDLGHRVNCLLEIAQAVAVDGMSAAEWLRYTDVAGRVLGAQRTDAMLRLTLAEREARRCRTELMFEEYED